MVRSLAHELAPHDVTANAISPGMIDTVRGATAGKVPASIAAAANLLGRKGRPEDVILAPDCGMKYLPRDAAFGKIRAMADAAARLRAELGA